MTSLLQDLELALSAGIYLMIILLIVCGTMALPYAAVRVLAKLIARLIARLPGRRSEPRTRCRRRHPWTGASVAPRLRPGAG